ncbi:MAG: hypothetical protein ACLUVC_00875 [Longibaculum sp.]
MQKRFKEYRMFLVCLVIFMFFIGLGVFSLLQKHIPQMIGAFLLSFIALFLLLMRYKMVLFDDMMMIYEWKIAAMLPTIIEYKDIQSIEKKSKHHLIIHHIHDSHIYVFDSDEFLKCYNMFNKA